MTVRSLDFDRLPNTGPDFRRAKIPGGWLLLYRDANVLCGPEPEEYYNNDVAPVNTVAVCAMTFIPDPEHKWDGGSLP